jgi:hypothetical protein
MRKDFYGTSGSMIEDQQSKPFQPSTQVTTASLTYVEESQSMTSCVAG